MSLLICKLVVMNLSHQAIDHKSFKLPIVSVSKQVFVQNLSYNLYAFSRRFIFLSTELIFIHNYGSFWVKFKVY